MKRAAAITGPTPSFVRWAIRYECAFRTPVADDLPYQTFRQLRSLREVSMGRLEERIVDGYCIHPDHHHEAENVRGFPVAEVLRLFGDEADVQSTCGACPANAIGKPNNAAQSVEQGGEVWAGCYGWVRSQSESCNLVDAFERAMDNRQFEFASNFNHATHVWFRLWQTNCWAGDQLVGLNRILWSVRANLGSADGFSDLANLHSAAQACLDKSLVLETELIPAGYSDGLHWRIESHCSRCRCELPDDARKCGECGREGLAVSATKRKVLGLRPYMLLKDILGIKETENLLAQFRKMKTHQ